MAIHKRKEIREEKNIIYTKLSSIGDRFIDSELVVNITRLVLNITSLVVKLTPE